MSSVDVRGNIIIMINNAWHIHTKDGKGANVWYADGAIIFSSYSCWHCRLRLFAFSSIANIFWLTSAEQKYDYVRPMPFTLHTLYRLTFGNSLMIYGSTVALAEGTKQGGDLTNLDKLIGILRLLCLRCLPLSVRSGSVNVVEDFRCGHFSFTRWEHVKYSWTSGC